MANKDVDMNIRFYFCAPCMSILTEENYKIHRQRHQEEKQEKWEKIQEKKKRTNKTATKENQKKQVQSSTNLKLNGPDTSQEAIEFHREPANAIKNSSNYFSNSTDESSLENDQLKKKRNDRKTKKAPVTTKKSTNPPSSKASKSKANDKKANLRRKSNLLQAIKMTCIECKKQFNRNSQFLMHSMSHLKTFICSSCRKKFKYKQELNGHHSHEIDSRGKLRKTYCAEKSYDSNKPFDCNWCDQRFRTRYRAIQHENTHTAGLLKTVTNENSFDCELCGKKFEFKYQLECHKKLYLLDLQKPIKFRKFYCSKQTRTNRYKCNCCAKAFKNKKDLVSHEKIHVKGNPKVHQKD